MDPATPGASSGAARAPPSPEKIQATFDLAIALILSAWPTLTVAVQNEWGGPDSSDKRDWMAGAISDLFADRPETDAADIEDVLLQVMMDEFEVNVEDGSEIPVAAALMKVRTETLAGNFETVDELQRQWEDRKNRKEKIKVQVVEENGEEVSGSDWEDDSDEELGDAPPLVAPKPKEKPVPEVDEDGFTKVVSKRR